MSTNFIFLHGGGQGSWVWNETIEAIKSEQDERVGQLVTLDVPGCGKKRQQHTETTSVENIVTSLLADIDTHQLKNAVLIGHSQAGTLMPLLIKARPDIFDHTIYVSCLAPYGAQTALNWREQMPDADSATLNKHTPGSRDFYRLMFCNDMTADESETFLNKLGSDQWPASSYQMCEWDYQHLAAHSSTYVICQQDAALLPSWQEIFARRLQATQILSIDAGHQVMNSQPRALAKLLIKAAFNHPK